MIPGLGEVETSNRAYVLKCMLPEQLKLIMWNKIMLLCLQNTHFIIELIFFLVFKIIKIPLFLFSVLKKVCICMYVCTCDALTVIEMYFNIKSYIFPVILLCL